jgi:hypothetical protein
MPQGGPHVLDSHDPALFVVTIRVVRGKCTGKVAFTQTVPGRTYRTPSEQLPLRPRAPAEFELRFSGQAVTATFDVSMQGPPGDAFAVHFLLARGPQSGAPQEAIDEARFELRGSLEADVAHRTVELAYDGMVAQWRTVAKGPPVIRVKQPAPTDQVPLAGGGVSSQPGRLSTEPTGRRSLHEAAAEAEADTVRLLLEGGADVHARTADQKTPLHLAVKSRIFAWMHTPKQLDVVAQLLDAGADPNARDGWGATPLHAALEDLHGNGSANLDVVRLLLQRGADPDAHTAGGLRPVDRPPHVRAHISPGPVAQEIARRAALLSHVNEMLDAARRGPLA